MTSHRVIINWRGEEIETLADIVKEDLEVLFVGLNPSPVSVARGHYHQGRLGQQFWKLLVDHQILPAPGPSEFHDDFLLRNGFGITDIVKRPSKRADLDPTDLEYGRVLLADKINYLEPRIVCSVYKTAIEAVSGQKLKNIWGPTNLRLGKSVVFILPFPYRPADEIKAYAGQLGVLIEANPDDR